LLVVDDEGGLAPITAVGLRLEGFEVELTSNADAALASLAQEDFDVAVIDLMLPGINGIQLARMIHERHPRTRIVLTSAYHLSERQLLRVDCGAVGFVPKPFDVEELARFLHLKLKGAESGGPFDQPGAAA
jgi:DNA-binding response OmpR family regulator